MLAQKGVAMRRVAKGLGPTGPGNRKSGGDVAMLQAVFYVGSADKLVNEAGIETVSRTDGIGDVDHRRRRDVLLFAGSSDRALRTALDHENGYFLR